MNYSKIIQDVCNRIGVDFPDVATLEWIKNEILNVSYDIFSITEVSKSLETYDVNSSVSFVNLPPDFYVPQETVFFDTDGRELKAKEVQYEKFIREYSDSTIMYVFTHIDGVGKLEWKPAFNGRIKLYYVNIPTPVKVTLLDAPQLHIVFYECIADGVALRWIKQKYISATTQEEIFKYNNLIQMYERDFDVKKQRIISHSKKTSSTQSIDYWDFLNDPNMIIF